VSQGELFHERNQPMLELSKSEEFDMINNFVVDFSINPKKWLAYKKGLTALSTNFIQISGQFPNFNVAPPNFNSIPKLCELLPNNNVTSQICSTAKNKVTKKPPLLKFLTAKNDLFLGRFECIPSSSTQMTSCHLP
jgi:hypothetical protein